MTYLQAVLQELWRETDNDTQLQKKTPKKKQLLQINRNGSQSHPLYLSLYLFSRHQIHFKTGCQTRQAESCNEAMCTLGALYSCIHYTIHYKLLAALPNPLEFLENMKQKPHIHIQIHYIDISQGHWL